MAKGMLPFIRGVRGFSLLELGVVLTVIGLLVSGGVAMTRALLTRAAYDLTIERLNVLQAALTNYSKAFGYFPCPADITLAYSNADYGVGTGTGAGAAACSAANFTDGNTVAGLAPVKTLRLEDKYGVDGFGQRILYAVDQRMTASGATTTYPVGSSIGSLTVRDDSGGNRTTTALYVLVSHGANGHGGFPAIGGSTRRNSGSSEADELKNCHCTSAAAADTFDSIFVQKLVIGDTESTSTNFDDVVRYYRQY